MIKTNIIIAYPSRVVLTVAFDLLLLRLGVQFSNHFIVQLSLDTLR